ncbi:hypothetical protein MMC34_003550 [Xylographa carneopallida]|nr:hypothetical protein [Xylographa carneopallida]
MTVPKKLEIPKNSSASNRKKVPQLTSVKKTAKNARHSSVQLSTSAIDPESRQSLNKKNTRPAGRGLERENRCSHVSEASGASVTDFPSLDNHVEGAGIHSAQGAEEHSTASKNMLKDGSPDLVPIIVYPTEQPQTVRTVAPLATVSKLANCEALVVKEQTDETGDFSMSEARGTSTEEEYVRHRFPDTSGSVLEDMDPRTELGSTRQALLQEELSAHGTESDALDNEDDRPFSGVKPLDIEPEDQYGKLRQIFRPSERGWTAIMVSLDEARQDLATYKALNPMFYEIMVLKTEYEIRTHEYRQLRLFRTRLDQYSLLSAAKKYLLLRDIREYITNALFHQCRQGYELLNLCFLHFRYLCEQRLQPVMRLRKWPWKSLEAYPSSASRELMLSARDSYRLFLFLYSCPPDKDLFIAAMHVRNVKRFLVGIKESSRYTLLSDLRDYEEVCVRRSNHDLLAVLSENPAIIPSMGSMSEKIDQSLSKQECSTVPYSSPASSFCVRDAESALELPFEQPVAMNTRLFPCINAHGKRVTTTISTPDSLIHITPPAIKSDRNANSGSGGSGKIASGRRDVEMISNKMEGVRHGNHQVNTRFVHEPLSYQIPEAKLKEAMLASRSTAPAYWHYLLYENMAGRKVKLHYCQSKQKTEAIVKLFLDKKVIGFDVEWKPNAQYSDGIRRNVSLIQLASEERIALFHIAMFPQGDTLADLLAPTLKAIMEDPKISKVGVSVKSDCTRLRRCMGIEARGLFELSHLYKLIKYSANNAEKIDKKLVALAKQVEDHLQLPLWKGEVRSSDWSQPLNFQQIQYAASDSYAGLRLYDVMEEKRKAMEPTPPRPEYAEFDLPIRLAISKTIITDDELDIIDETASPADIPLTPIEQMASNFIRISIGDKEEDKAGEKLRSNKPLQVFKAEDWVTKWRSNRPKSTKLKATLAHLRAYSLWQHQTLEVLDTAGLLRDPPLPKSTVASYIFEAISREDLPYETTRLGELFEHLPKAGKRRYQDLNERLL